MKVDCTLHEELQLASQNGVRISDIQVSFFLEKRLPRLIPRMDEIIRRSSLSVRPSCEWFPILARCR